MYSFINSTEESALMRTFFGIDSSNRSKDSILGTVVVDELSCISSSCIGSGSVTNCVLSNVRCNNIDAIGCVLINVTANSIYGRDGCIVYNVADSSEEGISLQAGKVLAGVFSKDGSHICMKSSITTDGGENNFQHHTHLFPRPPPPFICIDPYPPSIFTKPKISWK